RTSAVISSGKTTLLIDASIDLRHQALREGLEKINGVLYTHAHSDHILGTDDLRCFNFTLKAPIPCYGTKETLTGIKQTFSYIFNPDPDYDGGMLPQLKLIEIDGVTP